MKDAPYSRIIYSPKVSVYILPGVEGAKPIDISQDIIEGSVTRTTEGVSTASFLVQSRKLKDNVTTLLGARIRPMDRIVVYLKKVKPILVFSGYLDVVPIFQAVPEPFVIEASCTLKRLEFTYWDPQLPHVYEILAKFGFIPASNGEGGLNFFTAPDTQATSSGAKLATGPINDTGFGAMLYFLLHNVGGWTDKSIWIDPLPVEWMQRAYYLFQVRDDWEERYNTAQSFLKSFLSSGGTSGGDGDSTTISGDSVAAKITSYISKTSGVTVTAEDFIKAGEQYNIDPRFLVVLAKYETGIGTANPSQAISENDMFGLGGGRKFSSLAAGIVAIAQALRDGGPDKYAYPLNKNSSFGAKTGIACWNQGNKTTPAVYEEAFIKDYKALGTQGSPVDIDKPYTITDQGIGTKAGGGADLVRETVNPSPSDRGPDTQLSVYIEAGHSGAGEGEMQPGYQKQTGGNGGEEVNENREVLLELKKQYDALSDDKKSKLNIVFSTYSSRPRGYISDVYISIHHDADFTGGDGYVGGPCQFSVRGLDEYIDSNNANIPGQGDQQGKPGPNYYQPKDGTGWKMPSELGEGRDRIDNDKSLIKNSSALIQRLVNDCSFTTGRSFKSTTNSSNQSYNRMNNYYGFYYSNAAACCIMELPALPYAIKYSKENIAKGILAALLQYQKDWKGTGKQKEPFAGTKTGSQTDDFSSGDNSDASKLIAICRKAAQANKDSGYTKMIYNSPGTRNKKLSECIRKGYSMDCSGFIDCGLIEHGLPVPDGSDTTAFWRNSDLIAVDGDSEGKKTKFEPGMFFIKGKGTGTGQDGHIVLITSTDGECVHCTNSDGNSGPQFTTVDSYVDRDDYDLCKYTEIGSTTNPGSSDGSDGSDGGSEVDPFLIAKSTAFNIAFNFPGSMMDSVLLTGERALENDVKLLDTIQEVCKASQRTFSSLPNGDFIAWYPDYFNLSGNNAWLRISPTEIKSCTISLNDNNLVTHLYILGNPFGLGHNAGSQIQQEWYEKLMGSGVVTIERPWVLDSFLRPFEDDESEDSSSNQVNKQAKVVTTKKATTASRPRPVLETQSGGKLAFLERYGARPYFDKIPTIRHPILEFFYAYHTFIQKWAEQYISRAEFTFMPELFPGMILEFDMRNGDNTQDINDASLQSITFYVKEVTHNFSYESGFSTTAILMAPGSARPKTAEDKRIVDSGNAWAMVLVKPPDGIDYKYKKTKTETSTKRIKKKKTTVRTRRANPGGSTPPVPPRTQNSLDFPSIDQTDGGNN